MPDPASGAALSRAERWNVVFVLAMSQVLQVAMVAIVAALSSSGSVILLSPQLPAEWTRTAPATARSWE